MKWQLLALAATLAATLTMVGTSHAESPPSFRLGFKQLADQIPSVVGEPVENEHFSPATGDSLQQTTRGLMVWRKADNWTAFTDGCSSWVNGPLGIQRRSNDERFGWEAPAPRLSLAQPGSGAGYDGAAEETALALINQSRRQMGVPPVAMDEGLRQIARSRACDMSVRNYFSHVSPEGKGVGDNLREAGFAFITAGENLGWGMGYGGPTESVRNNHDRMMAETPPNDSHRRAILNAAYGRVGIGVYTGPDGKTFYVSEFTN